MKNSENTAAARIAAAHKELARLDKLLLEVGRLKEHIENAGTAFAAGEITVGEAAGLLTAASTGDRAVLLGALRRPVKLASKAVMAGLLDLVDERRTKQLDELQAKLEAAEKQERQISADAGLPYEPGPATAALAEQVTRQRAIIGTPPTRGEVDLL